MRFKIFLVFLALLIFSGGSVFGEEPKAGGGDLRADVLIETFFEKRTGDLPEMLKRNQIRVLVVPSRSTYFLDHKG